MTLLINGSWILPVCGALLLSAAARADGEVAWRVQFDGLHTDFEPVVGGDGTVYSGNADAVTAFAPDGTQLWQTPADSRHGTIAVHEGAGLVLTIAATSVVALDSTTGATAWSFDGGDAIVAGPGVAADGNVYAVADTKFGGIGMFSLTPAGALRWSDEGEPALSDFEGNGHRITFSTNRVVVGLVPGIGNPPPTIWAFDFDGNQQYNILDGCAGQFAVDPDGRLVTGNGLCQQIRVYDAEAGAPVVTVPAPSQSPCSGLANVAVGPDGSIYTAFCYRAFWSVTPDGTQRWFDDDFATYFWMDLFGVAPDNSVVIDLGRDPGVLGWIRAFSPADGSFQWQVDLPAEPEGAMRAVSRPVFDADTGRLYFHAVAGVGSPSFLYAVDLEPGIPGDIDGDGIVGVTDLLVLLAAWGPCPAPCAADLTDDGVVGIGDLLVLLAAWT